MLLDFILPVSALMSFFAGFFIFEKYHEPYFVLKAISKSSPFRFKLAWGGFRVLAKDLPQFWVTSREKFKIPKGWQIKNTGDPHFDSKYTLLLKDEKHLALFNKEFLEPLYHFSEIKMSSNGVTFSGQLSTEQYSRGYEVVQEVLNADLEKRLFDNARFQSDGVQLVQFDLLLKLYPEQAKVKKLAEKFLNNDYIESRYAASKFLGELENFSSQNIEKLTDHITQNTRLAHKSARMLGKMGTPESRAAIRQLLRQGLATYDLYVVLMEEDNQYDDEFFKILCDLLIYPGVVEAYERIKTRFPTNYYRKMCDHFMAVAGDEQESFKTRERALEALAKYGDLQSLTTLQSINTETWSEDLTADLQIAIGTIASRVQDTGHGRLSISDMGHGQLSIQDQEGGLALSSDQYVNSAPEEMSKI